MKLNNYLFLLVSVCFLFLGCDDDANTASFEDAVFKALTCECTSGIVEVRIDTATPSSDGNAYSVRGTYKAKLGLKYDGEFYGNITSTGILLNLEYKTIIMNKSVASACLNPKHSDN